MRQPTCRLLHIMQMLARHATPLTWWTPAYRFLSDSVPLFGYRRRSYLVGCGLLGDPPLLFWPVILP